MNYIIYRKAAGKKWEKHHYQGANEAEARQLYNMLRESFPSLKWTMVAILSG